MGEFLGQTVLAEVTALRPDGDEIDRFQVAGVIVEITPDGIRIERLEGGGSYTLPPHPDNMQPAAPGVNRLAALGQKVQNSDLLATWVVQSRIACHD